MASSPSKRRKLEPCTALDLRLGLTTEEHLSAPLGWGIIGASSISSDWSKSLKHVPGSKLCAVAARCPEKAETFRKEHGFEKVHQSYADLCADPAVHVVYVGTITSLHKEHSLMAIRAGKHVLCEKPLAENTADAVEMFAAAEAKGVMLMEGMWTRFFPAVEHARAVVETGAIGDVVMAVSDFPDKCYAVQAAPLAFGSKRAPTGIIATACASGAGAAVVTYDTGHAILNFPSWKCEFAETTELVGTKGRIVLHGYGHCPTGLTVQTCPAACYEEPQGHTSTSQNGIQAHTEEFCYPLPEPAGYPHPGWHYANQHGFLYQAKAVHRCIVAGLTECPQYTKADSLAVMHILDEVSRQIESPK